MSLARHPEVDLPIFDPDTPLLVTPAEFQQAVAEGQETFVRSVRFKAPECITSLQKLLEVTRKEQQKVSKLCGGELVPHRWGMLPASSLIQYKGTAWGQGTLSSNRQTQQRLTPAGYHVVAEVSVVQPAERNSSTYVEYIRKAEEGCTRYRRQRAEEGYGYYATDVWERQLTVGHCLGHIGAQSQEVTSWYVDVEPTLGIGRPIDVLQSS